MLTHILLALSITSLLYWGYNVIHSLFITPLRKLPGPLLYQLFPIIIYYHIILGKGHILIYNLHKQYGSVVRVGWSMVSFDSEAASKQIYSTYDFPKTKFYSAFQVVGETIFSTRNKEFHKKRRKMLSRFFSDKIIESFEPIINSKANDLVNKMTTFYKQGYVFDLINYFNCFSFDVIYTITFGNSFNMIKKEGHLVLNWIKDVFSLTVVFANEAIKNSDSAATTTILNTLNDPINPETNEMLMDKQIIEESILQLIAGTHTTANSLTWTFYSLLQHPQIYKKLKQELIKTFPTKENITYAKCKSECPYLAAVLHESLRLLPVVSGNVVRVTPRGGRVIDGYFIPEKTIVGVNIMALHNSPKYWKDPEAFNPERWIQDDQFKMNNHFMPFLIGPRACIGRTLAWMDLYLVSAHLVRSFNFDFKDKEKQLNSLFYGVSVPDSTLEVQIFK
ncbi:cytochrome P450 [Neoconidiobolus thromboides FSU 785]|nr:cytochrome P450 [Neoconidiobolus thromboides FSU 785]